MSIQRITQDNIEVFALHTYPERTYVSSSSGITGSVLLFARENRVLKDAYANEDFGETVFQANSLEDLRRTVIGSAATTGSDISGGVEAYLEGVNSGSLSPAWSKKLEVTRFTPSVRFTKDTLRKAAVKDVLFPHYRTMYPCLNWGFTNYHTLNFFTASTVPESSALIYPAGSGSLATGDEFSYSPPGSFTFEFWINPRYTTDDPGGEFKAGSILHLSSSYCLSLVSGSGRDLNGYLDTYRVMLQLSHSADIPPSTLTSGPGRFSTSLGIGYQTDLIFTSSEIPRNSWSHVAVRWEAPNSAGTNPGQYTGSFVINGAKDSEFYIPSASVIPQTFTNPQGDPDALFVGNYYDGPNRGDFPGTPLLARFFNINSAYEEGLTPLYVGSYDPANSAPDHTDVSPADYDLSHPLNAELHDIRIYDSHRTLGDIDLDRQSGPSSLDGLLFYLPPFFVRETRERDVLQTPFKSVRTTTDDPFNVALSFGVAARLINLPNFTRELVRGEYPRLFHLTASEITTSTTARPANDFLYEVPSAVKGNLTILPCDNGLFTPNFSLLRSGSTPDASPPLFGSPSESFVSDTGVLRYDQVSLRELVLTSSYFTGLAPFDAFALSTGSISAALEGATPEDPGIESGPILTVLDRTRDPDSNEVTFFDISNLFYGRRLIPEAFSVFDSGLTGSDGKIPMRIKDNGAGGLYRADSNTPHALWSNVGSIVYDEGLVAITDPTAIFYGKDQFEVSMKGMRPVFVKEINVLAPAGSVNSSSNPNWIPVPPTDNANETADKFVYITHVNLHDDNLNVVGKASLAQPIVKRSDDKFLIRLKIDY
jgi:hypothetical protein